VAIPRTPFVRRALKALANAAALVAAAPFAALSGLEHRLLRGHEGLFRFCSQVLAIVPGPPGNYVRRGFYRLVLDRCHADWYIGFGAMFTHREAIVERGVYVGLWALVGSAHLREGTSIGSRASLLSGTDLHEYRHGRWTPADRTRLRQIVLGPHAFVGEGAVVMADIGAGSMAAAGAVVSAPVPEGVVVAGNPARFVRRLDAEAQAPAADAR
jgi:virginiamycin A acetyltransferase